MASLQSTMKAFENLGRVLDEETKSCEFCFTLHETKTKICGNTWSLKMASVFDKSKQTEQITEDP